MLERRRRRLRGRGRVRDTRSGTSRAFGRQREARGHVLGVLPHHVHGHALVFGRPQHAKQEENVEHARVAMVTRQTNVRLRPEDDGGVDGDVVHDGRQHRGFRGVSVDVAHGHALVRLGQRVPPVSGGA